MTTGVISAVSNKDVTTKFGVKKTYSFQADGAWYSCGFKDPGMNKGDAVEFEFTENTYGKNVDMKTLRKTGTAPVADVPKSTGGGYSKGVFPVPLLDGSRAIIRQNALTNARESIVASFGGKAFTLDDAFPDAVIHIARKFEAYTTGDLDMAEAESEVAAE